MNDLKKVKSSIRENDYINFDGRKNKDNLILTKHARNRCKERYVDVSLALRNKGCANIVIKDTNVIVTVLGVNGRGGVVTFCSYCHQAYKKTFVNKEVKCKRCFRLSFN